MTIRRHPSWIALAITVVIAAWAAQSLVGEVLDWKWKEIAGTIVHYRIILPKNFDPAKAYPAVLAFPGGEQTRPAVDGIVDRNWRDQAEKRGYIVIIPAAPGRLFFQGGERVFPEFLNQVLHDYKIQDNKFHIAGASNGGVSAFFIAASYPQYFWSVTGFPGYLPDPTPDRIRALAGLCINMHVGELDDGWLQEMQKQAADFRAQGFTVRFTVEKGQAHQLETFAGDGASRLFNQFAEAQKGCAR